MARAPNRIGIVAAALVATVAAKASADAACSDGMDALLLLDRSGSMKPYWTDATASVSSILAAYQGQHRFGLLMFPDGGSCSVTTIEVPIGDGQQQAIGAAMAGATPGGMTPLAEALQLAGEHFATLQSSAPRAAVVITDGVETCQSPDSPASVAADLLREGIKTHVISIKVTATQLDAIAQQGGTGKASVIDDVSQIYESLDVILDLCCGNGLLDPGETCDTGIPPGSPGGCPADCDDDDPCSIDRVSCRTTCAHRQVSTVDEDGCCHGGDGSEDDPDCLALCGNGQIDGNERCDTAIPQGSEGACDCGDNDPCTSDVTRGCYLSCFHTPVEPDPLLADGCCPDPAMSASEDIDCEPKATQPADAGPADAAAPDEPGGNGSGCALADEAGPPSLPWLLALLALLALPAIRGRLRGRARTPGSRQPWSGSGWSDPRSCPRSQPGSGPAPRRPRRTASPARTARR